VVQRLSALAEEEPKVGLPSFPNIDLFSAAVNALYGALIAANPSHNRGFTVWGLIIMGYLGGIGGGCTRDLLLNEFPAPLEGPIYPAVCLLMGLLAIAIYRYSQSWEERFRIRFMAYLKSFSLPWFAILGAHKALEHNLGIFAAIIIGIIATTAGGVLIDLFSGITPEVLMPSEQLVTAAAVASAVYTLLAVWEKGRISFFPVTLIAVLVSFLFRVFAVKQHWPSVVPCGPPVERPEVVPSAVGSRDESGMNRHSR
jgi:uncharacterized membrane protein YeiH